MKPRDDRPRSFSPYSASKTKSYQVQQKKPSNLEDLYAHLSCLCRSFGNENWEFDDDGLMRLRLANINDLPISESERKYHWPLGRRPDSHPELSDYGF